MKAGTVIACPKCFTPQLISTKDLNPGSQMKEAKWESMGFNMENTFMNCHLCHELWTRQHPKTLEDQVYTAEDGWISLAKTNKPAKKRIVT